MSIESIPPPADPTGIDFQLIEELTSAEVARVAGAALLVEQCNHGEWGASDSLHAILDNIESLAERLNKHAARAKPIEIAWGA